MGDAQRAGGLPIVLFVVPTNASQDSSDTPRCTEPVDGEELTRSTRSDRRTDRPPALGVTLRHDRAYVECRRFLRSRDAGLLQHRYFPEHTPRVGARALTAHPLDAECVALAVLGSEEQRAD